MPVTVWRHLQQGQSGRGERGEQKCWNKPGCLSPLSWLRLTQIVVPDSSDSSDSSDSPLSDAAAPTSDDQEGRRQLTLIDGKTGRTEDWVLSSMLKLPICDLHVAKCIFATEIEFEKNPCYKLPLTLSDMNVRRKFQSWKPGMQLLFKKLSGGLRLTWQISAGLSPVIAMLTLSNSPL